MGKKKSLSEQWLDAGMGKLIQPLGAVDYSLTLSDLFGDNISDSAKADLEKAGELAAKELEEKVSGADRKTTLLDLIDDYRVAINNGCCESAFGDTERMKMWEEKEKSLLAQITKMINDGV